MSAACNLKGWLLGLIVGGTGFGKDIGDIYMMCPLFVNPLKDAQLFELTMVAFVALAATLLSVSAMLPGLATAPTSGE